LTIENRFFFYPKDVLTAIQQAFRPTHDCLSGCTKPEKSYKLKMEDREKKTQEEKEERN